MVMDWSSTWLLKPHRAGMVLDGNGNLVFPIGDSREAGLRKQDRWCFESGTGSRVNANSVCGIGDLGE